MTLCPNIFIRPNLQNKTQYLHTLIQQTPPAFTGKPGAWGFEKVDPRHSTFCFLNAAGFFFAGLWETGQGSMISL